MTTLFFSFFIFHYLSKIFFSIDVSMGSWDATSPTIFPPFDLRHAYGYRVLSLDNDFLGREIRVFSVIQFSSSLGNSNPPDEEKLKSREDLNRSRIMDLTDHRRGYGLMGWGWDGIGLRLHGMRWYDGMVSQERVVRKYWKWCIQGWKMGRY